MKGQIFALNEEIDLLAVRALSLPNLSYQNWFEDWNNRWYKCILSEVYDFEKDNINFDK